MESILMQYFIIGSGVDADYSTIDTFVVATCSGIKQDSDVPYVALLQPQLHLYGNLSVSSGNPLDITMSYTDSGHYYIFRPQVTLWEGSENFSNCAILQQNNYGAVTYSWPNYSEIHNCVFSGIPISTNESKIILQSYDTDKYGCLFTHFDFNNSSSTKDKGITFFGFVAEEAGNIYNCVFSNIKTYGSVGKEGDINIFGDVYNCAFTNVSVSGDLIYYNILYNSLVDIQYKTISLDTNDKNNVFTTSNTEGLDSSNIFDYDDTNHFKTDTYITADSAWVKGSGVYQGINYGSINGVEYWPYTWYDIGPLYFEKNILVLTQNNQSLVFRTK